MKRLSGHEKRFLLLLFYNSFKSKTLNQNEIVVYKYIFFGMISFYHLWKLK